MNPPSFRSARSAAVWCAILLVASAGCENLPPEQHRPAGSSSMTRSDAILFAAIAWASAHPDRRSFGPVSSTGSMLPSFDSRSILLLERLEAPPLPGDILSVNEGPGRENIGHRVRFVKKGWVWLEGDNNHFPDGWYSVDHINWRVAGILYTNGN
jgi:signal peptidase I